LAAPESVLGADQPTAPVSVYARRWWASRSSGLALMDRSVAVDDVGWSIMASPELGLWARQGSGDGMS
jgi:hypothetical protein